MMLLIDVGNSRLKWTVQHNGALQTTRHIEYRGRPLSLLLEEQWAEIPPPKRVLVTNVAGQSLALALAAWVQDAWGLPIDFMQVERESFGVRIAYDDPSRFGVDRWVALVAARHLLSGAVCVIDCGTAITLDVMDADGIHIGGLIVPGLMLMRKSLTENTQGIGAVPHHGEHPLLAQDTATAVQAGSYWAAVGFIDRVVNELRRDMQTHLNTVITGGDAALLLPRLAGTYRHEPDWLMKGMAIIAEGKA
jgi:type III pantothenate kinase